MNMIFFARIHSYKITTIKKKVKVLIPSFDDGNTMFLQ